MERRIFFRDFRLKVSIGIHDFEKEGPQTVVVNLDLGLAPTDKAHGDRIGNVLNYGGWPFIDPRQNPMGQTSVF